MDLRAIIFDLDGTLLDSIHDIANAMNTVLSRYNFEGHNVSAYKKMVGDGIDKLVERALPLTARDQALLVRCTLEMRNTYSEQWAESTQPYEGIPGLLNVLTRRQIKMAVLTNKPHEFARAMVKNLLPSWEFDPVFGSRIDIPKKPDPAGALEIADRLGMSPDAIGFVGDTAVDIHTANQAGMVSIGATWGFRDEAELTNAGARYIIHQPQELLSLLEEDTA